MSSRQWQNWLLSVLLLAAAVTTTCTSEAQEMFDAIEPQSSAHPIQLLRLNSRMRLIPSSTSIKRFSSSATAFAHKRNWPNQEACPHKFSKSKP